MTYNLEKGELTLVAEIHLKVDLSLLFSVLSSIILCAHQASTPGPCLHNFMGAFVIQHNNMADLNESDGHILGQHNCENSIETVVDDMR